MRPGRRWLGWFLHPRKTVRRCENREREKNKDGASAYMCNLMLRHWAGAFREREKKGSLVEAVETTGLVFEHLSPLHSPLCLQKEESG